MSSTHIVTYFKSLYPDLVYQAEQECTPILSDLSLLERVYSATLTNYHSEEKSLQEMIFIASALKLYSPSSFFGSFARHGLNERVASILQVSNKFTTCKMIAEAKVRMKKNPAFREKVATVTSQFTSNCFGRAERVVYKTKEDV